MTQCRHLIHRPRQFRASRCMMPAAEGSAYCARHSPEAKQAREDALAARVEKALDEGKRRAESVEKMQAVMRALERADVVNMGFGEARSILVEVKAHLPILLKMALRLP